LNLYASEEFKRKGVLSKRRKRAGERKFAKGDKAAKKKNDRIGKAGFSRAKA